MKLRAQNKYKESLKKFDRSIELYPAYFQAWAERGHLRLAMGNRTDAMKDFEHACQLNRGYGPALRGLGLCQFQQDDYASAIQTLERAVEAEPTNATDYYFLGIACVALDRRELAHASLQKALSLDPQASVRAHVHLASLLIKENRPGEAAREIEIYLEAVPDPFDGEKLRALLAQLRAQSKP
jgi:tetratricopeptide (TPR) repeat protein